MSGFLAERQRVLDACLTLAERGHIPGTGGNVGLRVSAEAFAVTPTASDYYSMQAEDICILRLDSLEQIAGEKRPSVEAGIHARLLRFRGDFEASVHTHQPIASAVSLLGISLELQDAAFRESLGPVIPVVPYAPSGTGMLARAFERRLRPDCAAYLLKNHGVVCGGKSLPDAIEKIQLVEWAAGRFLRERIQQRTMDAQSPVAALREPLLEALFEADSRAGDGSE